MKRYSDSFSIDPGVTRQIGASQRGALTLAVSLAILMLSTLVTFNVSKAILMEQKITNNDSRAQIAFEAAEAGIIEALSYLENNPDVNGNGAIDPVFDTNADNLGDTNTKTIGTGSVVITTCDLGTVACANNGPMTSIRIVATGFSDDKSASRSITHTMITINPLANAPDNPFITRGSAGFGGSVYVENLEGHSTIWTGGSVSLSGSGGTAVPNVNVGYPTCMDVPQTCTPADASNSSLVGLDVVENDSTLSGLSAEELFINFFGMSSASYRASMVTIDTNAAGFSSAASGAKYEVIWYEGGGDWQNVSMGCTSTPTGQNQCAKANMRPTITIVNGNVRFRGNNKITGIVFVMGELDIAGNTRISGSIVSSGDFAATTGSLDIHYRSDALAGTARAGAATGGAGTWKDF